MPSRSGKKVGIRKGYFSSVFQVPSWWMGPWQVLFFGSLVCQIYVIPSAEATKLLITEAEVAESRLMYNLTKGWPYFDPNRGTSSMYAQAWDFYLEGIRRRVPLSWKTGLKLTKEEGLFAGMPGSMMPRFEVEVKDSIKSFLAEIHENVSTLKRESDHQLFHDEEWEADKIQAQTSLRSSIESLRIFFERLKVLSPDLSEMAIRVALTEGIVPSWIMDPKMRRTSDGKVIVLSVADLLNEIPDEIFKNSLFAALPSQTYPAATGPKAQGKGENPPVTSLVKINDGTPDTNRLCGLSKSSAVRDAVYEFEREKAPSRQFLVNGDVSESSGFNCRLVKFGLVRDPKDKSIGLDPESYAVFPDGRQIKLNNDDLKSLRESWNQIQSGDRIAQPRTVRRSSGAQ
ncbi:MAG: hypothetical protein IPJ71_03085 [Bdellovibrionales bacterium]|nr:hypothetical protein [Bdellovibrionales bacterium]